MSRPLTADELLRAFRKWGVPTVETPGWRTHNRNHVGAWGPVYGTILHHTGDDSPDSVSGAMLSRGRSDLPGPLCTWGMQDDGVAVMIGNGRANHAGSGSATVLQAVIQESYGDHELHPGFDSVDGNTHFYGQETMYSGGHPMTIAAYRSTVRAHAAIDDAHGWTSKSNIGHREWSRRKPDPGKLNLAKFRRDVDACLAAGPGNWPVKEPHLRKQVTAVRESIKHFLERPRRKKVKDALLAADRQLAKIERR